MSSGERRQLTVMFCDLAGSTELSTRLDPEDLQDVIRAYQEACASTIAQFEGYVAKYMGDGILVYFGYPQALERDAERAVRAALAIVDAMPALNDQVGRNRNIELVVRIGIATGVVAVGETVGEGQGRGPWPGRAAGRRARDRQDLARGDPARRRPSRRPAADRLPPQARSCFGRAFGHGLLRPWAPQARRKRRYESSTKSWPSPNGTNASTTLSCIG